MAIEPNRFRCDACNQVVPLDTIVTVSVPHPTKAEQSVTADQCPKCGECNYWTAICDEAGCDQPCSCGTPIAGGYRRTCGQHRPAAPPIAVPAHRPPITWEHWPIK